MDLVPSTSTRRGPEEDIPSALSSSVMDVATSSSDIQGGGMEGPLNSQTSIRSPLLSSTEDGLEKDENDGDDLASRLQTQQQQQRDQPTAAGAAAGAGSSLPKNGNEDHLSIFGTADRNKTALASSAPSVISALHSTSPSSLTATEEPEPDACVSDASMTTPGPASTLVEPTSCVGQQRIAAASPSTTSTPTTTTTTTASAMNPATMSSSTELREVVGNKGARQETSRRRSSQSTIKEGEATNDYTTPSTSVESSTSSKNSTTQDTNRNKESLAFVPLCDDGNFRHNRPHLPTSSLTSSNRLKTPKDGSDNQYTKNSSQQLQQQQQKKYQLQERHQQQEQRRGGGGGGRRRRRRVSFASVHIRRYPMVLADNPACASGPPLSLGWEYEVLPEITVTDYETFRLRSRRSRTNHLVLGHYKRVEILQRAGYGIEEIHAVEREMARVRRQRQMTATMSPFCRLEQLAETATRRMMKLTVGRQKKSTAAAEVSTNHVCNAGTVDTTTKGGDGSTWTREGKAHNRRLTRRAST